MFVNEDYGNYFISYFSINVNKTYQNFNKHRDHLFFKADFQVIDTMDLLTHFIQVS